MKKNNSAPTVSSSTLRASRALTFPKNTTKLKRRKLKISTPSSKKRWRASRKNFKNSSQKNSKMITSER
jgi:hypothetical protein